MPLREDLLTPIAGDSPAGPSLRYDRVYDQIKEARTEEDDSLPSGAWARQTKRADYRAAAKLAGEALATRSKDLQLAVWMGEALIKMEGVSLLAAVLQLLLDLQIQFWETLHPEMDEGDAGMRAVPLQWAANRYAGLLKEVKLTGKGVDLLEYKAARAIGTEEDASSSDARRALREEAIAAGRLTGEDLEKAIAATPKSFYVALESLLADATGTLTELDLLCEERYGEEAPSFRTLRTGLEEVANVVTSLLREKRKTDPDAEPEAQMEEPAGEAIAQVNDERTGTAEEAYAHKAPREQPRPNAAQAQLATDGLPLSVRPESWEDALARIEASVAYLDEQQPGSPLPFLLRSSMRMGEVREMIAQGGAHDFPAPPTELRQRLKRIANGGEWLDVHREALAALGTPSGRAWLDLFRYLWTSARELGWEAQQSSIASALRERLGEMPALSSASLDDDTPAASHETLRWIAEEISLPAEIAGEEGGRGHEPAPQAPTPMLTAVLAVEAERANYDESEPEAADLLATARGLAADGQLQGAIQLLARDAAQQPVGRLRFSRNLQIAELCVENGHNVVAVPILQGLVREVEERKLETWEPRASAARPYALLLKCGSAVRLDTQTIFSRLCAIDPGAAFTMAPLAEG